MKQPHEDVLTLASSLAWLRRSWETLPVPPTRTHIREVSLTEDRRRVACECLYCTTEDVGTTATIAPQFSGSMWVILGGSPTDTHDVTETVMCQHHRLRSDDVNKCPDCAGDGWYENRVKMYRSPMAAALHRLGKIPKPSDGTPRPSDYIYALWVANWNVWYAARLLGIKPVTADHALTVEAMFTLAIRQLHSRYSAGPVARIGWVEKSEAQRAAEDAA